MLKAAVKQFRLGDDGIIRYQPDASNPLPGEPAARLLKGDKILEPRAALLEGVAPEGEDGEQVRGFIEEWAKVHIRSVLEPLAALEQVEGMADPVRGICEKLNAALGIVPREDVESLIAVLDPAMRQVLRAKQVRLGPVLVFIPALNKPAGVRLRGLLWSLWNEKSLPPLLPHDGIVSFKVEAEQVDRDYHRAIGYPVYGPRAIRIDMLDRVISAVYDSAKEGKFQAQHKMAEWLGCQIADLYDVLTTMGHRKIHDPADEKPPQEDAPAPVMATETPSAPVPEKKPDLATFALKKGKAFEKREVKPPAPEREERKPRPQKPKTKKREEKKPEKARVAAFAAAPPSDSPFAILGQLKEKKNAS